MTKIKSHQPQKVPASCEKVNLGRTKVIDHVRSFAVIPFPMDDLCAFTKDATSFDHWVNGKSDLPNDDTANMFRKIWNVIMASVQQKNVGTPPYKKKEFLSKKRYADFKQWGFNKQGNPQPHSFVPGPIAEGGILVFDKDVAAHLKHLEENTMHLPASSRQKKKKNADDDDEDDDADNSDPVPPEPVKKTEPYIFSKFELVLQPVRSTENPFELGGFFLWIFCIDPNWSIDQGCHNFINAVATYKSEIKSPKFPSPIAARSLNVGLVNGIKEICLEDPEMTSFGLPEWVNYCAMYNFASDICREKINNNAVPGQNTVPATAIHLNENEERLFDTLSGSGSGSNEDIEMEEDDVDRERREKVDKFNEQIEKEYEKSQNEIYEEYFRDPKSDNTRSFCNIFSLQKAIDIAKANGMNVTDLVEKKVCFDKIDGTEMYKITLKSINTRGNHVEESVYYNSGRDEDFDCLYVMRKEDFFWSDSASGVGLKYTNFPWVRQSESPIFRTVNIRWPKSMRRGDSRKRAASVALSQSSPNSQSQPATRNRGESSSPSASSPSQEQRKRQKTKDAMVDDNVIATGTRLITPLVTQRASLRGVDISNTTLCGKPFYVNQLRPSGGSSSVDNPTTSTFTVSDDAKKDSITYLVEAFKNWRSSLANYLETAKLQVEHGTKLQVEHGKLQRSPIGFNYNLIIPNRFMRDFYKERAIFQNTAATHLLRLFKEGAESVMTVPGIHLGAFYLEHIHNKKVTGRGNPLMNLYLLQDDLNCTLFASSIKKQAFELRHTHEIITNWREFIIIYFGCLDIYRHEKDLHWCYLGSGEKGVGKSFLLERIMFLFVKGTVRYYFDASKCGLLVDLSDGDWIIICDEMPSFLTGAGDLNKAGYTSESSVNSTKTAMTTGSREYRVFSFLDLPNGEKGRFSSVVSTPCVQCIMVVCNNSTLCRAMQDRFYISAYADKVHADTSKNSTSKDDNDEDEEMDVEAFKQSMAEKYGNNQDGNSVDIELIKSMNGLNIDKNVAPTKKAAAPSGAPISMMDMQSNIRATDRKQLLSVSKFGYSVRQTLHYVIEKSIAIGILPTPDMTLCSLLLTRVLKYLSENTRDTPTLGLRSYARIVREARTMVISDAINNVFFCACRDRDVINEKTLLCIGPYLWCQVQHAVFAITLSMNQIIDPHQNAILFAAIEGCCKFPLTGFIKAKQTANFLKVNRDPPEVIDVEDDDESNAPAVGPNAPLIRRGGTSDAQTDAQNLGDQSNGSQETLPIEVRILLNYYKQSRNGKHFSNISWRTVREKERDAAGGYDKNVTKIDLNYVRMTGTFAKFAQTTIQENMRDKLSQEDILSFLEKMQHLKIKVPHSIKPALAEELLIGGSAVKLYEENHEFNIFEFSKDHTGSESFRWDFCVHAVDKLGNGNNLIKSAIKDALEYAGLIERPNLITGFPESQLQSGKFAYMKLKPNPQKPHFEIRSTSYQEKEIINILRFNETLVGDKQTLEEITSQLDESYTKSFIHVEEDIELYMAKRCLKNMGEPLIYLEDEETKVRTLKWLYTNQDGEVEVRALPTAENQRIRNIYYVQQDLTGMRTAHENFMLRQHGKIEYPSIDYESLFVDPSILEKKKKT